MRFHPNTARCAAVANAGRRAALAAGCAVVALAAVVPASADEASCAALAEAVPGATIASAAMVAANAETDAPAYCEVTATISPVEGSQIGVVYRLPDDWNGKVLGLGGGGWMGNVRIETALPGLRRGYATLQTDGGHDAAPAFDTSWAIDESGATDMVRIEDFSYRAVHEMTVTGKAVAAAYYGREEDRAYWQGCSTGGRQGLMELQRFPDDYDGVIAGAPVYDFRTQTSGWVRGMNFADPARRLSAGHPALLHESALAACDGADGVEDGVIGDPRACAWDPGMLTCQDGEAGDACLTPHQVDAVRVAYDGVQLSDGSVAAFPLSRGTENQWARYAQAPDEAPPGNESGLDGLNGALFGDPAFDMAAFDPETHVPLARGSDMASLYEAGDPDIGPFLANGGKLLMWHGFNDTGPSPIATVEYYENVVEETGAASADGVRLFLAPGVNHCRGGAGPDQFDLLTTLEGWVEEGRVPDEMAATKADSDLAWSLCAYPKLPRGRQNESGETVYVCE